MLGFRVRYVAQRVVSVRASIVYRRRCMGRGHRGANTVLLVPSAIQSVASPANTFRTQRHLHRDRNTVLVGIPNARASRSENGAFIK